MTVNTKLPISGEGWPLEQDEEESREQGDAHRRHLRSRRDQLGGGKGKALRLFFTAEMMLLMTPNTRLGLVVMCTVKRKRFFFTLPKVPVFRVLISVL